MENSNLVGYKQVQKKFFLIKPRTMLSLGCFQIKDMRDVNPGTWWYSLSFLFIEITWGVISVWEKKEDKI